MVASSNSILDFVPLANMKALIDATFEFGRYPIELEEGGVKGKVWKFQGKARPKEKALTHAELDVEFYVSALLSNNVSQVIELVKKGIDSGVNPSDVVWKGLIPAMTIIGKKFQTGEIYIPEMVMAAKVMSETLLLSETRLC
jgi:hypothetical protein